METEDNFSENNREPEIEIYSKRAIWWFSVFSPLFGAILLSINLWKAGFKSEISKLILFAIFWIYLSAVLVTRIPLDFRIMSIIFNVAGAAIIAEYFYVKYFPEKDYYPKSIANPILILLILIALQAVIAYKMGFIKFQ